MSIISRVRLSPGLRTKSGWDSKPKLAQAWWQWPRLKYDHALGCVGFNQIEVTQDCA